MKPATGARVDAHQARSLILSRRCRNLMTDGVVVNSGRIVHETVDGEVIIIDLETGHFFSLKGCGDLLWPAIVAGTTPGSLTRELAGAFGLVPSDVEATVKAFLDELEQEAIIREQPIETAASLPEFDARAPFEPPRVEKHTNMSDLLLLDPIHDVDEQGWPARKPA